MTKEKRNYSSMPGNYDTDKLTDLHSSETDPSNYARNLKNKPSEPRKKDSINSSDRSIRRENELNLTERIPTLAKYTDMNSDSKEFDYKGEI